MIKFKELKEGIDISLPGKIKLNIGIGLLFFYLLIYMSYVDKYSPLHATGIILIFLISVFAHEFGHLYVSRKLGYSCDKIQLTFWGQLVNPSIDEQTPNIIKDEGGNVIFDWKIPFAGPLANIILASIGWALVLILGIDYQKFSDNIIVYFAYVNTIMLLNLLPIFGLDGCHILRYVLSKFVNKPTTTSTIIGVISLLIALPIWILS